MIAAIIHPLDPQTALILLFAGIAGVAAFLLSLLFANWIAPPGSHTELPIWHRIRRRHF